MMTRSSKSGRVRQWAVLSFGLLAMLVLVGLGRPQATMAATILVGPTRAITTIQGGVNAASAGDTIQADAGTYCEQVTINKSLTIIGAGSGAGGTIVDGNGGIIGAKCNPSGSAGTVFTITSATVTLENLTVENGCCVNTTGGGIINNFGVLNLTNATLSGNASDEGGGIDNHGTAALTNVTLNGNSAGNGDGGGAIFNEPQDSLALTNVTITNNTATAGDGGGLSNSISAIMTLSNVSISSNTAVQGGGIYNWGTATLKGVAISGNSASIHCGACAGGGISNYSATLNATNVTISGNSASSVGGGIYNDYGPLSLTNVTISGNSAGEGGGILNSRATATLQGSIIANSTGGDCYYASGSMFVSNGGSAADDTSCSLSGPSDLNGANPLLGPLANNGGPTQTMALQPNSPAIDRVPTTLCPPPSTDQRGVTRPQGPACDSGAYELVGASPTPTPTATATAPSGGGGGSGGVVTTPTPSATSTSTPSPTPSPTASPTPSPAPSPTSTPGCATVSYAAGWNLAGGPNGTVLQGAAGSLFTFQASDTGYETFPTSAALSGGVGVWTFFFSPTTVTLPCVIAQSLSVPLPANHFIMVGNPFDRPATLSSADVMHTFNPATNSYTTATGTVTLGVGQGAWVFSSSGGMLTITST